MTAREWAGTRARELVGRYKMPNGEKQRRRKERKCLREAERRSDQRTAQFVAGQLNELQDELADLITELRTFEHYSEIEYVSWCLMLMQKLKRKYRKFDDDGAWPD